MAARNLLSYSFPNSKPPRAMLSKLKKKKKGMNHLNPKQSYLGGVLKSNYLVKTMPRDKYKRIRIQEYSLQIIYGRKRL